MPPKGAKEVVGTGKGKRSQQQPSNEHMQSDENTPSPPKKGARNGKRKELEAESPKGSKEPGKDRPAKRRKKGEEEEQTGPGIRVRLTIAGSAPVRLDPKAQAIRSSRKQAAKEVDTAKPFPNYGKETTTGQTKSFFSTISPQVSPTDSKKAGYYPLAWTMPANRGKFWNKIVLHRTCAVCGAWFHEGGGDGQYVEHMRLYHPEAPRSNQHGLPRVPHTSLITQKIIPRENWELVARTDAKSRALFASLPGSEVFYSREQVRPNGMKEFAASGDNPPPRGGHPFFPWDMANLSGKNRLPPPPALPRDAFRISNKWRKDFSTLDEDIKEHTTRLAELTPSESTRETRKGKGKAIEEPEQHDEDSVDPRFTEAMQSLEEVIEFFIGEATKCKDDKTRLEYVFRNLHLIMYQARLGFAAALPEVEGEPEPVREAREFLRQLFKNTAPDDPKYAAPIPPGVPPGVVVVSLPPELVNDKDGASNEGELIDYPHVDVAAFVNHMDELHTHRTAIAESTYDDGYKAFFDLVAQTILPYHNDMHFNAKHTDVEWENLELARFKAVRKLRSAFQRHRFHRDLVDVPEAVVESRSWLASLFGFVDPNGADLLSYVNDDYEDDQSGLPDGDLPDSNDADLAYVDDESVQGSLPDDGVLGEGSGKSRESPGAQTDTATLEDIELENLKDRLGSFAEELHRMIPGPNDKRWTQPTATYAPDILMALTKGQKDLSKSRGKLDREKTIANQVRNDVTWARNEWIALEPGILRGLDVFNQFLRKIAVDLKLPSPP